MKCILLAAGYATRLYPLTENFPKPLLKVREKTILDWLVDDVHTAGIVDEYIVISNHRFAAHFQEWAAAKQAEIGVKVTVVDDMTSTNETRLGAVRDIQYAIDELQLDDDVLVAAGDNVLDFSLCRFLSYFGEKAREKGTAATCIMRYYEPEKKKLQKSGVLLIDGKDRVLEMAEKPEEPASNWCCPAFYIYSREDVPMVRQAIEAGCHTDAPGSFISWLCKQRPVYAMEMPGKRYDIGNLESYEKVQVAYKGIEAAL